jgi:hypothetical protein
MATPSSARASARRLLAQSANDEILDAAAVSPAGRSLNPLAKLLYRNSSLSMDYEISRGLALAFGYARAEGVRGDYAEFSVWKGRTFIEAWRLGGADGERRFFAFDSFDGLPEIVGRDTAGRFRAGEFRHSRRGFEGRLRRAGVPSDRVHIVEGDFDEVLSRPDRIPLRDVAIAYVDSPIYALAVPVLDYLTPRLVDGAVLMFDAWLCFKADPALGQAGACAEWLERNPDLSLIPTWQYNWAGQAFIVRRDGAAPDDGPKG